MHLVVLSTYPPRRCGLAAFTEDLRTALAERVPHWRVEVCAVDRDDLRYGPEVVTRLRQDDPADYHRAAGTVAATGADLVLIQHEYNIFGGQDGDYLLRFTGELDRLGLPYVVTLHTVRTSATDSQRRVMRSLCRNAARVTGFGQAAGRIAVEAGWVAPQRFVSVPHGVPAPMFNPLAPQSAGPALAGALAGLAGARVLSTFGLLRPGKGLETAIEALPQVVAQYPQVRYVVAGATHPETLRRSGEQYRQRLTALARDLGVAAHVRFVDSFLTEADLGVLLGQTEIYLTPYRSPEQTCSGALTFALAAGCAVVSTAYRYARELVPPGAGVLVPFDDPAACGAAISALLADPARLHAARQAARAAAASLSWPAVGERFAGVFAAAGQQRPVRSDQAHPDRFATFAGNARPGAPAGGESTWSGSPPKPASRPPWRPVSRRPDPHRPG